MNGLDPTIEGFERHYDRIGRVPAGDDRHVRILDHTVEDLLEVDSGVGEKEQG